MTNETRRCSRRCAWTILAGQATTAGRPGNADKKYQYFCSESYADLPRPPETAVGSLLLCCNWCAIPADLLGHGTRHSRRRQAAFEPNARSP